MRIAPATYIADTHKILPPSVDSEALADVSFACDRVGRRINRLAIRAARDFGIRTRPTVLDLDKFPEPALCDEAHSPLNWAVQIVDHFRQNLDAEEIGFLSVGYNISAHIDLLPNLASQIALATGLTLDVPPLELAYYGCASGLYSLQAAVNYCEQHQKAAIVFCFDQCTWRAIRDVCPDNPNLKAIIRTNLLFSDGGIGILVVPEALRSRFSGSLPRVTHTMTRFERGDSLKMVNGNFLVGDAVAELMPPLVMEKLVGPALRDWEVDKGDIAEWSIHQGGPRILQELCKAQHLGLSDRQAEHSRALFQDYGNLSSPCCLFVLDHHFHQGSHDAEQNVCGAVLSFGAGYYMGMTAYRWEA